MIRPPLLLRPFVGRFPFSTPLVVCLAHRPFVLAEGLCLSTPFSTSFVFSDEVNLASGFSLRPGVSLHHPHFSCTTPALRLQESQSKMPLARAVCYYASHLGKGT
jgi:hypothetical protein